MSCLASSYCFPLLLDVVAYARASCWVRNWLPSRERERERVCVCSVMMTPPLSLCSRNCCVLSNVVQHGKPKPLWASILFGSIFSERFPFLTIFLAYRICLSGQMFACLRGVGFILLELSARQSSPAAGYGNSKSSPPPRSNVARMQKGFSSSSPHEIRYKNCGPELEHLTELQI